MWLHTTSRSCPDVGLTKSSALRGGHRDVNADERVVVGQDLVAAGVPQTLRVAYPDLFAVHDPAGKPLLWIRLPVPCTGC